MTNVQSISAWRVALPLSVAFGNASSRIELREIAILRVESEGQQGWGEAAPYPGHAAPPIDQLWSDFAHDVDAVGLDAVCLSQGLLRGAFNQALDDLSARLAHRPLWSALGGGNPVRASAAIGVDGQGQPDRSQLHAAADAGYRHVKLKVTPATEPVRIAGAIAAYPQMRMGLDANGSLGEQDAGLIAALDAVGAEYLEQPGAPDDLAWHRKLRTRLDTPIALDESAHSIASIEAIVGADAADIVTLKVGRFGTSATIALAERALAGGVSARVGGLIETGIGRAHAVAAASHPAFATTGDVAASDRYFTDAFVEPPLGTNEGVVDLPSGPGIGVTVDMDALHEHAVASITVD